MIILNFTTRLVVINALKMNARIFYYCTTFTTAETTTTKLLTYPPEPRKPSDDECCGSGCSTCVFDLYDLELSKWRARCQQIDDGQDEDTDSTEGVVSVYEYRAFRITDIKIDYGITYFTFEVPGNGRLPLALGQHLVVRYARKIN